MFLHLINANILHHRCCHAYFHAWCCLFLFKSLCHCNPSDVLGLQLWLIYASRVYISFADSYVFACRWYFTTHLVSSRRKCTNWIPWWWGMCAVLPSTLTVCLLLLMHVRHTKRYAVDVAETLGNLYILCWSFLRFQIDEVLEEGVGDLKDKVPTLLVLNKKDLIKPGEIAKKLEVQTAALYIFWNKYFCLFLVGWVSLV